MSIVPLKSYILTLTIATCAVFAPSASAARSESESARVRHTPAEKRVMKRTLPAEPGVQQHSPRNFAQSSLLNVDTANSDFDLTTSLDQLIRENDLLRRRIHMLQDASRNDLHDLRHSPKTDPVSTENARDLASDGWKLIEEDALDGPHHEHAADHGGHGHVCLRFLYIVVLLGCFTTYVLEKWFPRIPYTCVLFIVGMIFGVYDAVYESSSGVSFSRSMEMWRGMDPHLFLYTFLPPLVFGEAMSINVPLLKRLFGQCFLLACPGVLLGTGMTALVAKYVFPYEWSWCISLLFGSVLSATDPVAVVALFKSLGVSEGLTMLISGESLLNDGTAVVVFNLLFKMAVTGVQPSMSGITEFFLWMTSVGPMFGALVAAITLVFLYYTASSQHHSSAVIQVLTTIFIAYLIFYVSESELSSSGLLGVVVGGILLAQYVWPMFVSRETVEYVWHAFEFVGNTLVFVIGGMIFSHRCADNRSHIGYKDVLCLLALYLLSIVIRAIVISVLWLPLNACGPKLHAGQGVVMVWAGLRGAVGLLLAVVLDLSNAIGNERDDTLLIFHVGGMAALTLLINGSTTPIVLQVCGFMSEVKEIEQQRIIIRDHINADREKHMKLELESEGWKELFSNIAGDMNFEFLPKAPSRTERVSNYSRFAGSNAVICASLRTALLRAIKGFYYEMCEEGLLSRRSHVTSTLIAVTGQALLDCGTRLSDWALLSESMGLVLYTTREEYDARRFHLKIQDFFAHPRKNSFKHYQHSAISAILAFTCAHRRAHDVIMHYYFGDDTSKEFFGVANEASAQIVEAEEVLSSFPVKLVDSVRASMLGGKLLSFRSQQIRRLVEKGILSSADAEILEEEVLESLEDLEEITEKQISGENL